MACFRSWTVLPDPPDLSSPLFISCIARSTFSEAFCPYFRGIGFSLVFFHPPEAVSAFRARAVPLHTERVWAHDLLCPDAFEDSTGPAWEKEGGHGAQLERGGRMSTSGSIGSIARTARRSSTGSSAARNASPFRTTRSFAATRPRKGSGRLSKRTRWRPPGGTRARRWRRTSSRSCSSCAPRRSTRSPLRIPTTSSRAKAAAAAQGTREGREGRGRGSHGGSQGQPRGSRREACVEPPPHARGVTEE